MNNKKTDLFLKNALIISLSGIIVKFLGAFYRIPLNYFLKSEGMGIYQTAFPVYLILMTFSGTAATTAIAKSTASGANGKNVLKTAFISVVPLGIIGCVFMITFSSVLSKLQGNEQAAFSYVALAPSLLFVSVISSLRGFFQGKNNMRPTAFSQIIEQTVKIAVGIISCSVFAKDTKSGAVAACFAVSAAEGCACGYLAIKYVKFKDTTESHCTEDFTVKQLIALLLPIALTSSILPLAKLFDSFTVVNCLKKYTPQANATGLYGLYSGNTEAVVGLPVAACYGIAAAAVPSVSAMIYNGENEKAKRQVLKTLSLTLFCASTAALCLIVFSNLIVNTIFSNLSLLDKEILKKLLVSSSINVILLSFIQTQTSILISSGKSFAPAISLFCGFVLKATTQLILLKKPEINIFALLYSDILCYFVAVFINLVYIISIHFKRNFTNEDLFNRRGNSARRLISKSIGNDKKSR